VSDEAEQGAVLIFDGAGAETRDETVEDLMLVLGFGVKVDGAADGFAVKVEGATSLPVVCVVGDVANCLDGLMGALALESGDLLKLVAFG